jgi:hypothetical protein
MALAGEPLRKPAARRIPSGMSGFTDLAPWTLLPSDGSVLAVGWIDRAADYPTGPTDRVAYQKLIELCRNPWVPAAASGFHACDVCQYDGVRLKDEIYLPGDGCIYVAPTGIVHYIAAHWYAPPRPFIDAVLACPPMRSMEYMKALLANGGQSLLRGPQI